LVIEKLGNNNLINKEKEYKDYFLKTIYHNKDGRRFVIALNISLKWILAN